MGTKLWQILTNEHKHPDNKNYLNHSTIFNETNKAWKPRTIFIDCDSLTIDEAKKSTKNLNISSFVSGTLSCGDSYARGAYSYGRVIHDEALDEIKRLAEECDNLKGFLVIHSCQGGTGAGFGSFILSQLSIISKGLQIIEALVVPSPDLVNGPLEIYNFGGYFYNARSDGNMSIWFNNQGLYDVLDKINVKNPDFEQINEVIATVLSTFLLGMREKGSSDFSNFSGYSSLESITQNLVPFPKVKYVSASVAPLICRENLYSSPILQNLEVADVLSNNNLLSCYSRKQKIKSEINVCASMLVERGNDNLKDIFEVKKYIYESEAFKISDHIQQRIKASRFSTRAFSLEAGSSIKDLAQIPRFTSCFMNSDEIVNLVSLYHQNFSKIYSKRAFVHWLVGEGLESGEMAGCREEFNYLISDYRDCFAEIQSDNESEEYW